VKPAYLVLPLLLLGACRSGPDHAPVIAEAYAGPATLALRKDIPLKSPVVATATHGERLEIIQRRRRFLKVRTPRGAEGWTEEYLLLSAAEIAALQQVEKRARDLPSQGVASSYEELNVHTEPNRLSPSFLQVKTGEKVDVVAHVSTPRTPPERPPLIPHRPKTVPPHKKAETKYPLPPMPAPPPPPANWRELSHTPAEVQQAIADEKAARPVPMDDWSLVRNSKGQSGWVLTRRLYMAIPDEVAQYAEGRRITSYFPLGDVPDSGQVKHNWLWTTIGSGDLPYDFDSFRVFIWSLRRHRYETAYIQRNLHGYFPVLLKPASSKDSNPTFSVCIENQDGARVRRTYVFLVNIVRFSGEQPCEAPSKILPEVGGASSVAAVPAAAPPTGSFFARMKSRIAALAKKWFRR